MTTPVAIQRLVLHLTLVVALWTLLENAAVATERARATTQSISHAAGASSDPNNFTAAGPWLYFAADDGIHGRELWRIDRREVVEMAGDYAPGSTSSNPRFLTPLKDSLFFLADTAAEPNPHTVVWSTADGAATSNPYTLSDPAIHLDPASASLWGAGETLIVTGGSETTGHEPILLDPAGADLRIVDTNPGPRGGYPRENNVHTDMAGLQYFIVQDRVGASRHIWQAGPQWNQARPLMRDKADFGFPLAMAATSIGLFVGASHARLGVEPWIYTATDNRIQFLRDIRPGESDSFPVQFREMNGIVYFQANDGVDGKELWRTDGTEKGTWLVADINPGPANSAPYQLHALEDTLLFFATTENEGTELWRSNGTREGTRLVADIYPGSVSSNPYAPAVWRNELLFAASHPRYGEELWRSDGTADGTGFVRDIAPGPTNSEPYNLTPFNGRVYFSANDTVHGNELWRTDGTHEGTRLLANIHARNHVIVSSNPTQLTTCGDYVYFVADDVTYGAEVWRSDVATGYTAMVRDLAPGSAHADPASLSALGDTLYFIARGPGEQRQLWAVRGGGPPRAVPVSSDSGEDLEPRALFAAQGALYITAAGAGGDTLYRLSSRTIRPVALGSATVLFGAPGTLSLAPVGDAVYVRWRGPEEIRFATVDSAGHGPRLLKPRVPLQARWPHFQRWYRTEGHGDATADEEAFRCYLAMPGMTTRHVHVGNMHYFAADSLDSGVELWQTGRGTTDARLLKDCFTGRASGSPNWFAAAGPGFLFAAEHAGKGREVWHSDGSADGTYVLDEPHSQGITGSGPRELTRWENQIWFSQVGNDLQKGHRTMVAATRHEGRFTVYGSPRTFDYTAYNPRELTVNGDYLYFTAEADASGRELWRLRLNPTRVEMVANIAAEAGYRNNVAVLIESRPR